jgi:DNA-binding response OmpR family regulator
MDRPTRQLLVVDDAPEMGFIVERLGRRAGCQVAIRPDVATAWDYLAEARPDLLIVDVNLPGENGLVLCRRVRSTPHLARLPIALFSLWDRPGDIAAGLESGSDYVLSKSLLCQPEQWQLRLHELFKCADSQPYARSLSWTGSEGGTSATAWIEALNQVLLYQAQRQLGLDVALVLVRRAAARSAPDLPPGALLPDGLGLDPGLARRADSSEMVLAFAISLANQVWCVLGSIDGGPLLRSLAQAVPALSESLTPQP